jgi:hypothetical protein
VGGVYVAHSGGDRFLHEGDQTKSRDDFMSLLHGACGYSDIHPGPFTRFATSVALPILKMLPVPLL